MDLVFATEARFYKDGEGKYYARESTFANKHWERYLECFDRIKIVARVEARYDKVEPDNLVSDTRISFIEIPAYNGIPDFLKKRRYIKKALKSSAYPGQAYILRVPGIIGQQMADILYKKKIPYALEVVGDPWDVWAPGVIKHSLRMFIRVGSFFRLKKCVRRASAVLYVTKFYLQKRYKPAAGAFTTNASNINMHWMEAGYKKLKVRPGTSVKLIAVGSLSQMYKSPDLLVDAIAGLNKDGINCELTWIGDGMYLDKMREYTQSLDAGKYIGFIGALANDEVIRMMKEADIFVSASKTEGLPRVIIEAMSLGLPCVATDVGGTAELLDPSALVPKGKGDALAEKIKEFIMDPALADRNAARNLLKAKDYIYPVLAEKRRAFYDAVKSLVNV